MIEFLRGRLLTKDSGHVVLDVGGVGYGVDVPVTTLDRLPDAGEEVALHTHLYLQEAIMRLYGFLTEGERDVFQVFLGTSGIGPKTALGILSSIKIGDFARAVLRNDLSTLMKIPGIGKKTAERLVVELRDKMMHFAEGGAPGGKKTVAATDDAGKHRGGPLGETIQALIGLGCKPAVAERASYKALEILGADASIQDLIKEALKHRY
ncbi:MAG: Holliday junction branch migration protein RuvA [Candidatus Sumerlaeaceae bacterium]|nr:Holliday junction branch migration protein RuvA [Candidatus Sumerlaeaceae bacterium]